MRTTLSSLIMLTLFAAPAAAGNLTDFPKGWAPPPGWHVDRLVKRAVADGDLTGTGVPVRAVLMTNDVDVRLVVFVNYRSPIFKVYNVFEEPEADLKSDAGINIGYERAIEIGPDPSQCGTNWVRCDKGRELFEPPMPTLWLAMGDWGGSVFRWNSSPGGFDRLSSGD